MFTFSPKIFVLSSFDLQFGTILKGLLGHPDFWPGRGVGDEGREGDREGKRERERARSVYSRQTVHDPDRTEQDCARIQHTVQIVSVYFEGHFFPGFSS